MSDLAVHTCSGTLHYIRLGPAVLKALKDKRPLPSHFVPTSIQEYIIADNLVSVLSIMHDKHTAECMVLRLRMFLDGKKSTSVTKQHKIPDSASSLVLD